MWSWGPTWVTWDPISDNNKNLFLMSCNHLFPTQQTKTWGYSIFLQLSCLSWTLQPCGGMTWGSCLKPKVPMLNSWDSKPRDATASSKEIFCRTPWRLSSFVCKIVCTMEAFLFCFLFSLSFWDKSCCITLMDLEKGMWKLTVASNLPWQPDSTGVKKNQWEGERVGGELWYIVTSPISKAPTLANSYKV